MSFISGDSLQKRNYNLILGDSSGSVPCTDGPVWSNVTLGGNFVFEQFSVAASPSSIVVMGGLVGSVAARAFYSLDNGATFNPSTFQANAFLPRNVSWGGGVFLANQNGSSKLFRSTDNGVNFVDVAQPFGIFNRISFSDGVWFGVDQAGFSIARSVDGGLTWSNVAITDGIPQSNVCGDNSGLWIVNGANGPAGRVWTSIDGGITWISNLAPWGGATCPRTIAYSPTLGMFAAVNISSASPTVWTSLDGLNWISQSLPNVGLNAWVDISWGDGVFIVVHQSNSSVAVSEDGITWNLSPNSMPIDAASVANNGSGIWIAQRYAVFPVSTSDVIVGIC